MQYAFNEHPEWAGDSDARWCRGVEINPQTGAPSQPEDTEKRTEYSSIAQDRITLLRVKLKKPAQSQNLKRHRLRNNQWYRNPQDCRTLAVAEEGYCAARRWS